MNRRFSSRTVDSARAAVYAPPVLASVPRLLGQLDRDPNSLTMGSFDREHWAWKFRDFPITMLQASVLPLAQVWRLSIANNPYRHNPELIRWIGGALEHTIGRQHRNGAFDSVAPNAHDQGVSLAMCYYCSRTLALLEEALDAGVGSSVRQAIGRAAAFALGGRAHEDYAFISNHRALFALGYLAAYRVTGESRYEAQAADTVAEILEHQSPDGWYEEYGGFDPGYESLGLAYLGRYWRDTESPELLASLERCIEHFAYAVQPDGSVGGDYGSRNTRLYFPSGFELLSDAVPMAGAIARFMRSSLHHQNVVTPDTADPANLPIVAHSYLEACTVLGDDPHASQAPAPALPWETLRGIHFMGHIAAAGGPSYYAILGVSKGTLQVYHRTTRALAYQDAGYALVADGRRWCAQVLGAGRAERTEDGAVVCNAQMGEVLEVLPTPLRFVVLRVLSLTVFRIPALARVIRRWIVRRLITRKRPGPYAVRRTIAFADDRIEVHDTLSVTAGRGRQRRVTRVDLPRQLLPFHMGSARYFHPSDLLPLPQVSVDHLREALNRGRLAEHRWSLRIHDTGAELAVPQGSDANPQPPTSPT